LACGAILAREGHKVCVLERNKQIGGTLQTYVRKKVIFDSGVHYVGSLAPGQNLNQIFRYLGIMDKFRLQKLDEDGFDWIAFNGDPTVYKYAQGYENFIRTLSASFPGEEEAIEKYCDGIRDICRKFPLYNLENGTGFEKMDVLGIDTQTFVESITSNKKLQNVLVATNLLYSGEAYKTPLYVHALIINHYIESSYRFIDGGSQIARLLYKEIASRDGVFFKRVNVVKLVEEEGEIQYAESSDGRRFYGKKFISNVHPTVTMEMTVSDKIKKAYRHRLKTLDNTMSSFSINIVLKKKTFKYNNFNYYYFDNNDAWSPTRYTPETWPLGYALYWSPTSKDSEYADGVTIITHMHFADVEKWANTFNTVAEEENRGPEYAAFKKEYGERLINFVSKKFPELKDAVEAYYVATPLTLRDYMGSDDGSMYGYAKDFRNPLKSFISPKTKIPNLFLTGQNINLHGVMGVTVSSVLTCSEILGMDYLIEKIRNA
jgi:all-trans-retinol 13,14-reductase